MTWLALTLALLATGMLLHRVLFRAHWERRNAATVYTDPGYWQWSCAVLAAVAACAWWAVLTNV